MSGSGGCAVYVFREGVFSAFGHDLKLEVADFTVEIGDGLAVRAGCRTDSVRVVGSLRGGRTDDVDERQPSPSDRQGIERDIAHQILESKRYPQATFRSTSVEAAGGGYQVVGLLDLHGVVKEVRFTAERRGDRDDRDDRIVARIPLNQPDFRIKPFRAMMGALRVKPEVLLEVTVEIAPGRKP